MRFGWRVGDTTGSRLKIHAELQESLDKSARAVNTRLYHHLQLLHNPRCCLRADKLDLLRFFISHFCVFSGLV